MTGVLIGVELVCLVEPFKLFLHARDILRRRGRVFRPEQAQQGAGEILRHIKGSHRLTFRKVLGFRDHLPPIAIYRSIDALNVAGHEVGLPATGTKTDDADFTTVVRLRLQVPDRRIDSD